MNESATQPFWMTETFGVGLLIVVALMAIAFIFRGSKLKWMKFKVGGIESEIETHDSPMQEIKGNILKGKNNKISTERGDTHICENTLEGKNQKIDVKNLKQ